MRILKVDILTIAKLGIYLAIAAITPVHAAQGDEFIDPCSQVVIGGLTDWVPYTLVDEDGIYGVGFDLAAKIFDELDIPTKNIAFDSHLQLLQALRSNEVDVMVSVYPNNDIAATLDLVQPGYIEDPITVAVKSSNLSKTTSWENLSGFHGVMDMTFTPDQDTQDFFMAYLTVRDKLTIGKALEAVVKGNADYLVGSNLQLHYAIDDNDLQNDIAVANNVSRPAVVYMGMRRGSNCQQYASFLTKRLQDYKNDGTVDELVSKYLASE